VSTISEVAARAGVSKTTVSLVLNNKGNISEKTRAKVFEIIDELGYIPDNNAQTLKNKKTNTIGLILPSLSGYFQLELIRGIEEKIVEFEEYSLNACSAHDISLHNAINFLTKRRHDGYIIVASQIPDEVVRSVAKRNIPIVVLDRPLNENYIFNIRIENTQGTKQLLQYMYDKGYRKLGIVQNNESFDAIERFNAAQDFAMQYPDLVMKKEWIWESDLTKKAGYALTDRYFQLEDKPDVIFCLNDDTAIGLMSGLQERGLRIPEDIAITGFDDIEISKYVTPSITTVQRPMYEIGQLAVELLFGCIGGQHYKEIITLETILIPRNSC
jgi:LacI family transcriptional regulator